MCESSLRKFWGLKSDNFKYVIKITHRRVWSIISEKMIEEGRGLSMFFSHGTHVYLSAQETIIFLVYKHLWRKVPCVSFLRCSWFKSSVLLALTQLSKLDSKGTESNESNHVYGKIETFPSCLISSVTHESRELEKWQYFWLIICEIEIFLVVYKKALHFQTT